MPQAQLIMLLIIILQMTSQQPICTPTVSNNNLAADNFVVVAGAASPAFYQLNDQVRLLNYTFRAPFSRPPSLAIAIVQLDSPPAQELYIAIKSQPSPTATIASFAIYSNWRRTTWTKVTISFLAESLDSLTIAQQQMRVNSIDGCCLDRVHNGFFPYPQGWTRRSQTSVRVWLSGFQLLVDNQRNDQSYSMSLQRPTLNDTGISWSVSTGEFTRLKLVEANFVLFVSYEGSTINDGQIIRTGIQSNRFQDLPRNGLPSYTASLFGFSALQLPNTAPLSLSVTTVNTWQLQFDVTSLVQNIAVEYFLISLAQCASCPGSPYFFNGGCYQQCPYPTVANGDVCSNCNYTQQLINGRCVCKQDYNNLSGYCVKCSPGSIWNGSLCVQRPDNCMDRPGTVWSGVACVCSQQFAVWDGKQCTSSTAQQAPQMPQVQQIPQGPQGPQLPQQPQAPSFSNPFSNIMNRLFGSTAQTPEPPPQMLFQQPNSASQISFSQSQAQSQIQSIQQSAQQSIIQTIQQAVPIPPQQLMQPFAVPTSQSLQIQSQSQNGQQIQLSVQQQISPGGTSVQQKAFIVSQPLLPPIPTFSQPEVPQDTSNNVCGDKKYIDPENGSCKTCSLGCSSCNSSSTCVGCIQGFKMQDNLPVCTEICGDGSRFVLICDDGNRDDGDGCSGSCTIETGFKCDGGSPTSRDICNYTKPDAVRITQVDQIQLDRNLTRAVMNIKVNWLPPGLASGECRRCNGLLLVTISQCSYTPEFSVNYLSGTTYNFAIILKLVTPCYFNVRVQIRPVLQTPHFTGVDISNVLNIKADSATYARASANNS